MYDERIFQYTKSAQSYEMHSVAFYLKTLVDVVVIVYIQAILEN